MSGRKGKGNNMLTEFAQFVGFVALGSLAVMLLIPFIALGGSQVYYFWSGKQRPTDTTTTTIYYVPSCSKDSGENCFPAYPENYNYFSNNIWQEGTGAK